MEERNTGNKDIDDAEDDEDANVDGKDLGGEDVDLLDCDMIGLVTINSIPVPVGDKETDNGCEEDRRVGGRRTNARRLLRNHLDRWAEGG